MRRRKEKNRNQRRGEKVKLENSINIDKNILREQRRKQKYHILPIFSKCVNFKTIFTVNLIFSKLYRRDVFKTI